MWRRVFNLIICINYFFKASNNLWLCFKEVRLSEKEINNWVVVNCPYSGCKQDIEIFIKLQPVLRYKHQL
jgi:hypothetical protein